VITSQVSKPQSSAPAVSNSVSAIVTTQTALAVETSSAAILVTAQQSDASPAVAIVSVFLGLMLIIV